MGNPLISVIIPVYNVEKYLKRCVDSLVKQTYKNLEIILIDDGSKDSSGKLCDEISKIDKRILVLHKSNGGSSSARNLGIEIATGKYITFVDSDDWLELDTYEYCVNLIKLNQADCIEFNTIMVENANSLIQKKEKLQIFRGKDILAYYMLSSTKTGSYSVCRCLFSSVSIKKLRFREGKLNEDIDFKYKALKNCNKLIVSNLYKYHYFQSGNSNSTGKLKKKDFDLYEASELLYELTCKENYKNISFLGEVKKARTAFSLLCKIAYYGITDEFVNKEDIIKQLIKEHRKNMFVLIKAPISINRKILSLLFGFNFKFTVLCVRITKKVRGFL